MAMTWQEHAKVLGLDPDRLGTGPRAPEPSTLPAPPPTTAADDAALAAADAARGAKYHNRRSFYKGRIYASRLEARRAAQLDLLVAGGIIRWWLPQPIVHLGPAAVRYTPDFLVVAPDGWRFEDCKGVITERFRVIVQLWKVHGPAPLHVIYRKRTEVIAGASDGGAGS